MVFWLVTSCVVAGYQCFRGPCCPYPEDGGSMVLRNVGILPEQYTASQPRRPQLEHHRHEIIKTLFISGRSHLCRPSVLWLGVWEMKHLCSNLRYQITHCVSPSGGWCLVVIACRGTEYNFHTVKPAYDGELRYLNIVPLETDFHLTGTCR